MGEHKIDIQHIGRLFNYADAVFVALLKHKSRAKEGSHLRHHLRVNSVLADALKRQRQLVLPRHGDEIGYRRVRQWAQESLVVHLRQQPAIIVQRFANGVSHRHDMGHRGF
ncbi:hypothetical protein SODG_005626 [Sodalis praecaptivus]